MLSCNITAFLNHTHVILQEICSRVNDALRRKAQLSQHPRSQSAMLQRFLLLTILSVQGQTPDALFDALAVA